MNFELILVISFILCNVSHYTCLKKDDEKDEFKITDYFITKLPELDFQQEPKILFDKSFDIFCELVSACKVFPDDHDFIFNHPELFIHKIPKNLVEVIMTNLNDDGQFMLYPEFPHTSFLLRLEDYPELFDFLLKIESLLSSRDDVDSIAPMPFINNNELNDWHEFNHYLRVYDFSSLFRENSFFQFIYDIEYVFSTPRYSTSKFKDYIMAMKVKRLQRVLGKKIYEQIEYYDYSDYVSRLSTTTSLPTTTKKWKKGNYRKPGGKKCFNLSQRQIAMMEAEVSSMSESSTVQTVTDESRSRDTDESTEKQENQERFVNPEQGQVQNATSTSNSSIVSICPDGSRLQDIVNNSTRTRVCPERCFDQTENQSEIVSSTPPPSDLSVILRFEKNKLEDIDLLPIPAEIKVLPTLPIYACAALDVSGSFRVKREVKKNPKTKLIKDPVLKILSYGTQRSNILNKEIYSDLTDELRSLGNENYLNISTYVEKKIGSGDSKTINNVLQKLCEDEEDESDEYYGYITYNDKSATSKETLHSMMRIVYDNIYSH